MLGLIQIIVIWGLIYYLIKKRKNGGGYGGGQTPNTTVHTAGTNSNQNNGRMPQNRNSRNGHWGQNMPWSHTGTGMQGKPGRNVPNAQRTPVPMPGAQTGTGVKMPESAAEEESTTAYLAKKAEEDAREHAREKWEEERRLREAKGGFAVAGRHLDGDPIPPNSRCVNCAYCAAENLVPMTPRTRYSCYFCREPLD